MPKVQQVWTAMIAEKMGFDWHAIRYPDRRIPRKVDTRVLNILSGIAQSAHKFSNDIRLLQHLKEIEEPFEKNQIGSSAMAYKRNPMRSERIAALSNYRDFRRARTRRSRHPPSGLNGHWTTRPTSV